LLRGRVRSLASRVSEGLAEEDEVFWLCTDWTWIGHIYRPRSTGESGYVCAALVIIVSGRYLDRTGGQNQVPHSTGVE
jgi:hypothetical protein